MVNFCSLTKFLLTLEIIKEVLKFKFKVYNIINVVT